MNDLFDLLIPAIFIIGSIFVNQMVKKGREEESSEDAPDEATNDLREVIRRQIEQRRLQQEAQMQGRAPANQTPPVTYNRQAERSQPVSTPVHENRYDSMRHQIEEMRSKAEAEQRKAASILKSKGTAPMGRSHTPAQHPRSKGLIGEVIRELHHPTSARKAVINMEILGPPVGLRRPGQVHASWEQ